MLYIENLTFNKELESINLVAKEHKLYHFKLHFDQAQYFWDYLMNESTPILGNMFVDDICYSKIDKNQLKSFNYNFISIINDKVFYSKTILVNNFIKNYIKIFTKDTNYLAILKKLDIPIKFLEKKISNLTNLEKVYVYLIATLAIKRKIIFIDTNYLDKNNFDEWMRIESKVNQICIENECIIVMIEKNNNKNFEVVNHKLTVSSNYDKLSNKKVNLFVDIFKTINRMFKIPLIAFIILYLLFFETSLLLAYSFGHNVIWSHQFIATYFMYSFSIAAIVMYIVWISIIFYRYKGFINNIPILFRQKIMYLCLHFWIVNISLILLSNIINLIINSIIYGEIKLIYWDSNFYMSLGVIVISIVLTPLWIISFHNDEKIKYFLENRIIKKWKIKN